MAADIEKLNKRQYEALRDTSPKFFNVPYDDYTRIMPSLLKRGLVRRKLVENDRCYCYKRTLAGTKAMDLYKAKLTEKR